MDPGWSVPGESCDMGNTAWGKPREMPTVTRPYLSRHREYSLCRSVYFLVGFICTCQPINSSVCCGKSSFFFLLWKYIFFSHLRRRRKSNAEKPRQTLSSTRNHCSLQGNCRKFYFFFPPFVGACANLCSLPSHFYFSPNEVSLSTEFSVERCSPHCFSLVACCTKFFLLHLFLFWMNSCRNFEVLFFGVVMNCERTGTYSSPDWLCKCLRQTSFGRDRKWWEREKIKGCSKHPPPTPTQCCKPVSRSAGFTVVGVYSKVAVASVSGLVWFGTNRLRRVAQLSSAAGTFSKLRWPFGLCE